MKKFHVLPLLALAVSACTIPLPGGEIPDCTTVRRVDGAVVVSVCDGGGAGSAGSDAGVIAGADAGPVGGSGGHGHSAGSGGELAGAGGMGHAGHGGLPVTGPLPAFRAGSQTFDVRRTGELPQRDGGGIGAARTRCFASHVNFDDSIVYPGQPGRAHAHQYAGADKSDAFGIGAGAGGTCRGGTANLSSYWWPALLTPEGRVLTPEYVDPYYKQSHYDVNGVVSPPPKGLKIVAGDAAARAAQNLRYFFWSCGDNNGAKSATVPSCGNQATVLNIHFPQCSNGQLDSVDHKSHMSFPVGGRCPASHPTLIPSISYHIYFRSVPAGSRLSCDSATGPGGYCIHGDIIVNWDEEIMRTMVERCVNTGLSCGSHMVGDGRILTGGI